MHCLKKVVDGAHTSDTVLSPGIWKGLIELDGTQVHLVVVQISHVGRKSKIQKYRNLLTILTDDDAERWWKYQLNDNQYWRWWREYWWRNPVWSAVVQYFRWLIHWVVEIAAELHRLDVEGGHDHLWWETWMFIFQSFWPSTSLSANTGSDFSGVCKRFWGKKVNN